MNLRTTLVHLVRDFRTRYTEQMEKALGRPLPAPERNAHLDALPGPLRSSNRLGFAHRVIRKFFDEVELGESSISTHLCATHIVLTQCDHLLCYVTRRG